ncbi:MAG: PglZ domain-containing protein, partial [Candidatus Eremiobacterota bacterium]
HLKRPEDELHRKNISHIINRWRNDIKNKDSYIKASMDTEQKFKIKNFNINPQKMVDIQTFISIEEKLIDWICEEFISGHSKNLYSIIEKKKHSFWACNNEKILMKWNILETSLMVCSISKSINNELKGNKFGTEELIKKYCYGENNWATLDGFHRELEQRFERFDVDLSVDYSLIEKAVVKARQIYMDNVGNMAEIFQSSCISSSFKIKDFLPQREIYSSTVKPLVNNGKTAYILVDALRYEMGVELVKGFGDDFEIEIKPAVSTLPSITNTGMTSLLPDAQKDFGIEETGGVNINGNIINSRKDRIKYLEEYLKDKKFLETKIENILKPSKKLRQEIKESDFILVTSQEIDAICEQGNITMARRIMSDILAQIRRSIRNLVELGIYNFVLTADHGYLFFEKIESANKIDVPEGNKIELHRRAWAGKGGNMSNSFILLSEKDIGLSGDCNLAFPKRIACFKVKGQDNPYFHGGISLQEMIIPLIIIKHKSVKIIDKIDSEIHLIIEKEKITTRFFTVQILWKSPGQLSFISDGEKYKRVRLLVRDNGNEVGTAVQAVYGFEDGTQDIILEKDKPDYVTVLIGEEIKCKTVNIYLLDGETFVELAKKEKIPVELSI